MPLNKTSMKFNDDDFKLAAVDIGNSRVKFVLEDIYEFFEYSDELEKQITVYSKNKLSKPTLLCYSTVNSSRANSLLKILDNNKNVLAVDSSKLLEKQELLKFRHIKGIGNDRLLGLLGAMRKFKPPLITVDCGTAITVNAVDADGVCRGGAIFAGIKTQAQALFEKTEILPEVVPQRIKDFTGKNTEDAIISGILASAAGGINKLIYKIKHNELQIQECPVIFTGGFSEMVISSAEEFTKYNHEPHLVLDGILHLIQIKSSDELSNILHK